MIRLVDSSAGGSPSRWILCFRRTSQVWWVRWLARGKFKHVSAFGYIAEVDHWVFLDWRFAKVDVIVARGNAATMLMHHYTGNADLLGMEARTGAGGGFRLGWYCVPAVKHLLGLRSSALRPDRLWRDCIRHGAEILHDGQARTAQGRDGPDAAANDAESAA